MFSRQAVRYFGGLGLCLTVLCGDSPAQLQDQAPIALLQPDSLDGWRSVSENENTDAQDVWTIKDGVLTCAGQPAGYLITTRDDFHDYTLSLEWRWHTGRGGNNGVLVHCSTPRALGVWCKSIEVQLANQDAGDFWIIGTQLHVPDEAHRRQDRRYQNLVDNAEKPVGEWNQLRIRCQGNQITVHVNGILVNHATDVSERHGAIALQSEGTPIQFRRIELRPMQ